MSADLTRSLAGGGPWLLMEHSTERRVSWQPRNIAKRPGEMRRNSLAHVARGADGVAVLPVAGLPVGAEKYHSAMLPHGGTDTRDLARGRRARRRPRRPRRACAAPGSTPDLALLWDWESWWALELEWRPAVDLGYLERIRA